MRVLRPGGRYVCITLCQEHIARRFLASMSPTSGLHCLAAYVQLSSSVMMFRQTFHATPVMALGMRLRVRWFLTKDSAHVVFVLVATKVRAPLTTGHWPSKHCERS